MSALLTKAVVFTSLVVLLLSALLQSQYSFGFSEPSFSRGGGERILLLTSHPDDESLFFGPTLTALHRDSLRTSHLYPTVQLYSICLSVGNADGLGSVRRTEYESSLDVLGIDKSRRLLVDHPELQDNITAAWKASTVADTIRPFVVEHGITTILTFDQHGISGHPNHRSALEGAKALLKSWPSFSLLSPPRLFSLISYTLPMKYIGPLSAILAKFDLWSFKAVAAVDKQFVRLLILAGVRARSKEPAEGNTRPAPGPGIPVYVAGFEDYMKALSAMREHASQLVWFRWLNVFFSRYMWINEWYEVKV